MPIPPCHRGVSLTQGFLLVAPSSCFIPCFWKWCLTEAPRYVHPYGSSFALGVCRRVCPRCRSPWDTFF